MSSSRPSLLRSLVFLVVIGVAVCPVSAAAPTIVVQPQSQTVVAGSKAVLAVSATGAEPLRYEWLINGSNPGNYNTDPWYIVPDVQAANQASYQVRVTSADGSESTLSDPAILTVSEGAPSITRLTVPATVATDTYLQLGVEATGTAPRNYRWLKDGVEIASGWQPFYIIYRTTDADGGEYAVEVSNSLGSATAHKTLAVRTPPPFAGGTGTAADPYRIATVDQLDGIRQHLTRHFVLTADLDLAGREFQPIGDYFRRFWGTFDGQGHAIRNWVYNDPATDLLGLFANVAPTARIANLSLADCHIASGENTTAGLLAATNAGRIENCATSGSVRAGSAGGLVGSNVFEFAVAPADRGVLVGCHSSATVYGIDDPNVGWSNHGGLAAVNEGRVIDCYATGDVIVGQMRWSAAGGLIGSAAGTVDRSFATGNVSGVSTVGGLVGVGANLSACFAAGTVRGIDEVGGLVGTSWGATAHSYATGAVTGRAAVGGFIGTHTGRINEVFSVGPVTGTSETGGFAGRVSGAVSTQLGYWDIERSGQASSPAGEGKTTAAMRDPLTFAAWSADFWTIAAGVDPQLRAAAPLLPFVVSRGPWLLIVALGRPFTLSVEAAGTAPLQYQWRRGGVDLPGATGPTYTVTRADYLDGGRYSVVVKNVAGTADLELETTVGVTGGASVVPPVITEQPQSVVVREGESTGFSVQTTDYALTPSYQWSLNGEALPAVSDAHGLIMTDPEGRSLSIPEAGPEHEGTYRVVVTNSEGVTTSVAVTLTVLRKGFPTIISAPQAQGAVSGDTVTFSVVATGSAPLTYQWRRNGVDILGATSAALTLANARVADSGDYTVVVTSSQGAVESAAGTLTVSGPVVFSLNPPLVWSETGAVTLTVSGALFQPGCVVTWNGVDRPTTRLDSNTLTIEVSGAEVALGNQLGTAVIAVRCPTGDVSNAQVFTIAPSITTAIRSEVATVTEPATVSTAGAGGPAAVAATLTNCTAGSPAAAVTVANYSSVPVAGSFDVGQEFVDLQVVGVDASDRVNAAFYYPAALEGEQERSLALLYFDGADWKPVRSSGGAAPVQDFTDNLDGTWSGGRFAVTLDATSTPAITALTGTVFTFGMGDRQPPVVRSIAATPAVLQQNSHKMVPVRVSVDASDNLDPQPKSRIVAVASNEPVNGTGDGDTAPDWQITGDLTVNLRAERSGKGDGRIYTITVETADAAGNKVTTAVKVNVPKGKK
jgi:hypothetical protein